MPLMLLFSTNQSFKKCQRQETKLWGGLGIDEAAGLSVCLLPNGSYVIS